MGFDEKKGYVPIPPDMNPHRDAMREKYLGIKSSPSPVKVEGKKQEVTSEIFVSHAVKDKVIANSFVDIILDQGLSVHINQIFCVSTDGAKIKSGEDWRNSIKEHILSAKIIFMLISPNFKESEVCLNEMGAAWVTNAVVIPLIIDPINYKTVGVIQEPTQIEKLLDEKSLDRIKDIVQEKLSIPPALIKSDRWTAKKTEFLLGLKKHLESSPFDIPVDRSAFQQLQKDKENLEKTVEGLINEKSELDILIKELVQAKDKSEVAIILKKNNPSTQYQEFDELCSAATKLLNKQPPIINGIIFKDFSKKEIKIGFERLREDIDDAIANDFIDEDLDVKWHDTKEMQKIYDSLLDLDKFLTQHELKKEFFESFEDDYDVPLDLRNKGFWEKVLGVTILFN